MNLNELFPQDTTVTIGGEKMEIKFGGRALIWLEKQYKSDELKDAIMIIGHFVKALADGLTIEDAYKLLFAGLLHTKKYSDYDDFVDAVEQQQVRASVNTVWGALMNAYLTPEQLEKLHNVSEKSEKNG